eukprot:1906542-Amphidinium_carterae.3
MCCSQATKEFLSDWEIFALLNVEQRWDLSFFVLECAGRPVPVMDASLVSVEPLVKGVQPEPFWPVKRKPYKKRAKHSQPSASEAPGSLAPQHVGDEQSFVDNDLVDNMEEDVHDDDHHHEAEESHDVIEDVDLSELLERSVEWRDLQEVGEHKASSSVDTLPAAPLVDHDSACAPPPPPPVVERERTRPVRGLVGVATAELLVPGGRLAYYKNIFEAQCCNKLHGKCVLSRTSMGRTQRGGATTGGRPLAFMALWLDRAGTCATKEEHWNKESNCFSHATRSAKRSQLEAMPAAANILSCERIVGPGEPSEQESLKGLWAA